MFDFLLPKHIKKAKQLLEGVKKFSVYNDDLMNDEQRQSLSRAREEFKAVLETRNKEKLEEEEKRLLKACEKAVPSYRSDAIKENIEVIIVAIIIALGIRAYFLQPFKIPTASMQPTLNGIIAHPMREDEQVPNIISQAWQFIARGRNYTELRAPKGSGPVTINRIEQKAVAMFFTYCTVYFSNGESERVYAPANKLLGDLSSQGLWQAPPWNYAHIVNGSPDLSQSGIPATDSFTLGPKPNANQPQYQPGQLLAKGCIDTGDQLLVDKVSYNFRKPKRGEVFVFNTAGIPGIKMPNNLIKSQHYIKRLAGVPGDKLAIVEPALYHNGKPAEEIGFQRVAKCQDGYSGYAVKPPDSNVVGFGPREITVEPVTLDGVSTYQYTLREKQYFAMGDNSRNSSDSRYWGIVPEENLVGPALFVYWPFQPHWSFIK